MIPIVAAVSLDSVPAVTIGVVVSLLLVARLGSPCSLPVVVFVAVVVAVVGDPKPVVVTLPLPQGDVDFEFPATVVAATEPRELALQEIADVVVEELAVAATNVGCCSASENYGRDTAKTVVVVDSRDPIPITKMLVPIVSKLEAATFDLPLLPLQAQLLEEEFYFAESAQAGNQHCLVVQNLVRATQHRERLRHRKVNCANRPIR